MTVLDAIAWLIERTDVTPPQYAYVPTWFGWEWTEDVNNAVRFSRREDAEQCLRFFEAQGNSSIEAREHMWVNSNNP